VEEDDVDSDEWEQWPDDLTDRAREVVEAMHAGRAAEAVDLLDELISDLGARRQTASDMANRRFGPSADDRHL
jgi:hypothetical protein